VRLLRFLALVVLALGAPCLSALDIPSKPTAWVTDTASLLSASQQQSLNEKLEGLQKQQGTQFLIFIYPSLEGEDLVDYTNRVANQWKIKGDKALILFVFVKDRKTWIQVGYGLEGDITDAFASRVYRNTLVPYFRQEQYYEGLSAAIDELAKKIDPNYVPQNVPAPVGSSPRRVRGSQSGSTAFFIFLFVLVFFILPALSRRRRGSGCSGCIWPLFWGGGGTTFGGGGFGGGRSSGGGWSTGGSWGGGGSSFGGGGAGGGW
jgi:uncharacterized protein